MTLPASGQISFNDLRVETGISSQAPFSITSASTGIYVGINQGSTSKPNATAPHSISEWYSYQHCIPMPNGPFFYASFGSDPVDPTNCGGVGNEYTNGPTSIYSNNCSSFNTGCKLYTNSTCTSPLVASYTLGNNGSAYGLDNNSVIDAIATCTT